MAIQRFLSSCDLICVIPFRLLSLAQFCFLLLATSDPNLQPPRKLTNQTRVGEGAYHALSKIPSAQLDSANPGLHLSDDETERYKGLFQSIKFEARPSNAFQHLTKTVTQSSLVGSTVAHRQATDAKCYFKDPFNELINDYLLQGTVLGTMESTWKIRPKSLPSRSLQSSWEDKA